jgi:hypothetical protein
MTRMIGRRKGQTEGKGLHQGSAGIGNTQCSVALDQADWTAPMQYQ